MFETHAEAIIPSVFYSEEGLLEWSFITQRFHAEWFYIKQAFFTSDGDLASRMVMIDDFCEFKSLLAASSKFAWVEDVYLVTPGQVNQTGTWAIDLLLEMEEITPSPDFVNRNFIYRVNRDEGEYFSTEVDGIWESLPSQKIYQRTCTAPAPLKGRSPLSAMEAVRLTQIVLAGVKLHGGDVEEGAKWIGTSQHELEGKTPLEMLTAPDFLRFMKLVNSLDSGLSI